MSARVLDTIRATRFRSVPVGDFSMKAVYRLFKGKSLDDLIDNAEVILAENVAEYFVESMREEVQEARRAKDPIMSLGRKTDDFIYSIPALAPPFQRMFIEYPMPASFFDVFEGLRLHGKPTCCMLVDAAQVAKPSSSVRWILRCAMYLEPIPRQVIGPLFLTRTLVRPDGSVFRNELCFPRQVRDREDAAVLGLGLSWLVTPAMLTIGFMNCRNVTVKTQRREGAMPKRYKRQPAIPYTDYKLLDIRPIKRVLRAEGQAATTGLRKALHICRGHFKTFDKDGPLFGQIEGTFWWGNHLRGQAAGTVVKDYRVVAPKDAA